MMTREMAVWFLAHPARLGSVVHRSEMRDCGYVTPCRVWTGYVDRDGYGLAARGSSVKMRIHRVSYIAAHGAIGAGMVIDHLCRNTSCWNPDHLEEVTPGENSRRMCLAHPEFADSLRRMRRPRVNLPQGERRTGLRTHCKRGHQYTPENTRMQGGGKWQLCVTCCNQRQRERRGAKDLAA